MTEQRKYHNAPLIPDAVQTADCMTEGCDFRTDVGPDGQHGHDPSHTVVLLPVDYAKHPLYADSRDRLSKLQRAQGDYKKRNPRAVSDVPATDSPSAEGVA